MRAIVAVTVAIASAQTPQTPTFRSTTATVAVGVSVKKSNNPVPNLTAADFTLTDNGVPQTIEAVSIENVPIDVTLFLDTSGSTSGRIDDMQKDVQTIVQFLRAGDRFRLLTIGDAVSESVPWVSAGTKLNLRFDAVGGISLIRDALMLALLHRPEPGRRHLVVGMTDRQDCGSVIPGELFVEMAARTDAVIAAHQGRGCEGETGLLRRLRRHASLVSQKLDTVRQRVDVRAARRHAGRPVSFSADVVHGLDRSLATHPSSVGPRRSVGRTGR